MRIITATQVERLLPMDQAISLMEQAMRQVSSGGATLPLRQFLSIPGTHGKLAVMPGALADPAVFGVKLVSKFPRAPGDRHGSHVGGVMLFDSDEGVPLALIDGATLTAIRTAAASALATDVLARPNARTLLVTGAGEQARRHITAIRAVRPLERVLVWARDPNRAEALAAAEGGTAVVALAKACEQADIICTTTAATRPYLLGEWLPAGCHLNLVGAAVATSAEVDSEAVRRARVFVDYRMAAEAAAGEIIDAVTAGVIGWAHVAGEIGAVLLGDLPGRQDEAQITLYKSLGVTAQDLAAATAVWQAAEAQGIGLEVDLAD
jgi:ornithine cyclodeaminase/alanine dehydrogenase-like protein (mu-crystallin family)